MKTTALLLLAHQKDLLLLLPNCLSDPEAEKAWTEILTGSLLKGAEITVIKNRKRALGEYSVQVAFRKIVDDNPDLAAMTRDPELGLGELGLGLDEELALLLAGELQPPDPPDPLA